MKVTISVTADDIENGKQQPDNRDVCSYCPVARAAQRTLDNPKLRVNYDAIGVLVAGNRQIVGYLPIGVCKRISEFDMGRGMQPFTFELDVQEAR